MQFFYTLHKIYDFQLFVLEFKKNKEISKENLYVPDSSSSSLEVNYKMKFLIKMWKVFFKIEH